MVLDLSLTFVRLDDRTALGFGDGGGLAMAEIVMFLAKLWVKEALGIGYNFILRSSKLFVENIWNLQSIQFYNS